MMPDTTFPRLTEILYKECSRFRIDVPNLMSAQALEVFRKRFNAHIYAPVHERTRDEDVVRNGFRLGIDGVNHFYRQ